jgi:hypothetical protein
VASCSIDWADAGHVAEPDLLTLVAAAAAAAQVEAERDAALQAAQQSAAAHASAERARAAAERAAQAALASAEARLEECAVLRARLAAVGVPSSAWEPASAADTYIKDETDGTPPGVARAQGLRAGELGEMKEGQPRQKGHRERAGQRAVFPQSEKVESNAHENSERGGGTPASSDAETQTIDLGEGPAVEDGRPSEQGMDYAEGSAWSSVNATTRVRTAWENERGATYRGGVDRPNSAETLEREEEEGAEEPSPGLQGDAEDTEHEGRRDVRVEVPGWEQRRGSVLASGTWDPRASLDSGWGMVSPVFRHRQTRRQSTGGWSDEGPGERSGGEDVERAIGPIWRRNSTVNLT